MMMMMFFYSRCPVCKSAWGHVLPYPKMSAPLCVFDITNLGLMHIINI